MIPGKVNIQEEYLDFIPDSKIKNVNTILNNQFEDINQQKHIQGNQMENLNNIAKPLSELTQKTEEDRKIQQIQQRQTQSDYLLYLLTVITALLLLGSVIIFTIKVNITLKKQTVQNTNKQKEEECPLQPLTTVIENPSEENSNPPMYPKLKMDF